MRVHSRRLCSAAIVLFALVLSATTAPSQDFVSSATSIREPPPPFLFRRRIQPGQKFRKEQLRDWLTAVTEHRPGERDDPARAAGSLDAETLADVVAGFEWGLDGLPTGPARTDVMRRAALLHTDIAVMDTAGSARPDRVNTSAGASLHLGAALELVDYLRQKGPNGRNDPFVVAWWRTVTANLGAWREVTSAPLFGQRALSLFPQDPEILLMAGAFRELLATPWVQESGLQAVNGRASENVLRAAECFRDALKNDPGLHEARVRLGHVLGQMGRHELAVAELGKLPDDLAPPALQYFRYLFLGEAHEALGNRDLARSDYERALVLYPGARSAHLALARLERRAGDRNRAVAAIRDLVDLPPASEDGEDPWQRYLVAGAARRAEEMLEELRAPFRRKG